MKRPKKPESGETRAHRLLLKVPAATFSMAGKKALFVTIRGSKHWPTLHCSAEGFPNG